MKMDIRLNIKLKLFLVVFISSLIILALINYFNYKGAKRALEKNAYELLSIQRDMKKDMLINYMSEIKHDLNDHSRNIIYEINQLPHSNELDLLRKLSVDVSEDEDVDLAKYDYLYDKIDDPTELEEVYFDLVVISKTLLSDKNGVNLYIFNDSGDMLFSTYRFKDFLRNIYEDDFKGEGILKCFLQLKAGSSKDEDSKNVVTDLSNYKYFTDRPVFFAGARSRVKGANCYLIMMVSVDDINSIMTGGWKHSGKTGETYLVGTDFMMRNDSRFLIQEPDRFFRLERETGFDSEKIDQMRVLSTTILLQEVRSAAALDALRGNEDTKIVFDYRGIPVLSSYSLITIDDFKWALLAEVEVDEAFFEIEELKNEMIYS